MQAAGEPQIAAGITDEWAFDKRHARLPGSAGVVIVGGGIVGCSAALFLARRGVSVALFEKGRIAGEQSGRNWGWVRQQGRDPRELALMIRSRQVWGALQSELGEDLGFAPGGCLYLAANQAELERHAAWLPVAREFGLDTRLLTGAELGGVLRTAGVHWSGALYTASDGRAEPGRATPAIARGALRAGAGIFSNCAARGVERSGGAISAVVTEHGTVSTRTVLCAAGAWTRQFCGSLAVEVPQLRVTGAVARLAPGVKILDGTAWASDVAIRRRADGGYTVAHGGALEHTLVPDSLLLARKFFPAWRQEHGGIRLRVSGESLGALRTPRSWALDSPSPFERERALAPAPSRRILEEVQRALSRRFPEIARLPLVESWAGVIEASPDVLPIVSPVAAVPGLHVATGFSGHGFGIGPGAGELAARMVTGGAAPAELAAFRLERFFDGSTIRPGPSI